MSMYRFKDAKMYSSGLIEYLWFPYKEEIELELILAASQGYQAYPHHHLRVIYDVQREDCSTSTSNNKVQNGNIAEEEAGDQTADCQDNEHYAEDATAVGEIDGRVERKSSQSNNDRSCKTDSEDDFVDSVRTGNQTNHDTFAQCKRGKQDDVQGRATACTFTAHDDANQHNRANHRWNRYERRRDSSQRWFVELQEQHKNQSTQQLTL